MGFQGPSAKSCPTREGGFRALGLGTLNPKVIVEVPDSRTFFQEPSIPLLPEFQNLKP